MEGKTWEKRNEQVEEIEKNGRGGLEGLTFLHNIKPSSFGELKNCIGGGFWGVMEGLYEFFKFNLCCYIIFKIIKIVIICINLTFSKKLLF